GRRRGCRGNRPVLPGYAGHREPHAVAAWFGTVRVVPANPVVEARRAAEWFAAGVGAVRPFGGGHINETFLVATAIGELVVQRLNPAVFPDPDGLTANIVAVHRHLRGACMPEPVPTRDGRWLLRDGSSAWRAWRPRSPPPRRANRSSPSPPSSRPGCRRGSPTTTPSSTTCSSPLRGRRSASSTSTR